MEKRGTPLKAIRAKCLDCSNGDKKEVKQCPVRNCPLWPLRMGRGYEDPSKPGVSVGVEPDWMDTLEPEISMLETACFAGIGENDH